MVIPSQWVTFSSQLHYVAHKPWWSCELWSSSLWWISPENPSQWVSCELSMTIMVSKLWSYLMICAAHRELTLMMIDCVGVSCSRWHMTHHYPRKLSLYLYLKACIIVKWHFTSIWKWYFTTGFTCHPLGRWGCVTQYPFITRHAFSVKIMTCIYVLEVMWLSVWEKMLTAYSLWWSRSAHSERTLMAFHGDSITMGNI